MTALSYAFPIRTDLFQEQVGVVYKTGSHAPGTFVIVTGWKTGSTDE